ncbi:MAG: hypothetical protein QW815_09875 [Nitrososphaerota archaeon]
MKPEDAQSLKRKVTMALILLPVLITSIIVGFVFLGFYLSDVIGSKSRMVVPFISATLGLLISIGISYFIAKWIAYSTPTGRTKYVYYAPKIMMAMTIP